MMAWRDSNLLLGAALLVGCSELPEEVMTTADVDSSSGAMTLPGTDSSGVDSTTGSPGEGTADSGGTEGTTAGTEGTDETVGPTTGRECTDEVCDGVDNDCDDEIDEGCDCTDGEMESCFGGDPGQRGVGQCTAGTRECVGGTWGTCEGEVLAEAEVCNGLDEDCDGMVDEDFGECTNGTMQPCYGGPMGTEGVGTCSGGMQNCAGGSWGPCNGDVLPVPEVCGNGMDDDCDGMVDDGCCFQVVVEPSFESGTPNPAWTEASLTFGTPLCDGTCGVAGARTGSWWAWFGGVDGMEVASLEQDVIIPMGTATLSMWLEINACAGTVEDTLTVSIDGVPQLAFDNGDPTCDMFGYTQYTTDVTAFADGGLHTLSIVGEVFGSGPPMFSITNFFVDDVTIEICS